MSRKSMPSKKQILAHWQDRIWDAPTDTETCWGCGFKTVIYRCHLEPHCETQNNDVSNLVLLCTDCHCWQEMYCRFKGVDEFVDRISDSALFMRPKMMLLNSLKDIMEI